MGYRTFGEELTELFSNGFNGEGGLRKAGFFSKIRNPPQNNSK